MEDIREIHYNGWRNSRKLIDIEVNELISDDNGSWIGKCIDTYGFVKYGDTKIQVIDRMRTELHRRGYDVGNLPEVMGIK